MHIQCRTMTSVIVFLSITKTRVESSNYTKYSVVLLIIIRLQAFMPTRPAWLSLLITSRGPQQLHYTADHALPASYSMQLHQC